MHVTDSPVVQCRQAIDLPFARGWTASRHILDHRCDALVDDLHIGFPWQMGVHQLLQLGGQLGIQLLEVDRQVQVLVDPDAQVPNRPTLGDAWDLLITNNQRTLVLVIGEVVRLLEID